MTFNELNDRVRYYFGELFDDINFYSATINRQVSDGNLSITLPQFDKIRNLLSAKRAEILNELNRLRHEQ